MAQLAHLYGDQIITENSKIPAVWLFGKTASDGLIRNKINFLPLSNIFDGLSVQRIIYQLLEIL